MNLISLEEVERYVDMYFKSDLRDKSRRRNGVYKRAIFTALALENGRYLDSKKRVKEFSLNDVGHYLGGFDHSTIIHYRDNIADMLLFYEEEYKKCYSDFNKYIALKKVYNGVLPTKKQINSIELA